MTSVPPVLSTLNSPTDHGPRRHRPTWLPVWIGAVGLAVVILVGLVTPSGQLYFPRCLLYVTTGWQCPGCGITRATHALLQGDWAAAWRLNPLWVVSLPVLTWSYVAWLVNDIWNRHWPQPLAQRYGVAILLGTLAGFAVARNLPWPSWLGR